MFLARRLFCQVTLPKAGVIPELFTNQTKEIADKAVSTGRAWQASELRLKSDDDLHKLWYVLLREQNILYSEDQSSKQFRMPRENHRNLRKVKQSMARVLTVVREREIVRETYMNSLKARFYEENLKPQTAEGEARAPPKTHDELPAGYEQQRSKRRLAVSRVKKWSRMNNSQRRKAIQKEYARMANEAKAEFLSELKLVGNALKEKGITPTTKDQLRAELEAQNSAK